MVKRLVADFHGNLGGNSQPILALKQNKINFRFSLFQVGQSKTGYFSVFTRRNINTFSGDLTLEQDQSDPNSDTTIYNGLYSAVIDDD